MAVIIFTKVRFVAWKQQKLRFSEMSQTWYSAVHLFFQRLHFGGKNKT